MKINSKLILILLEFGKDGLIISNSKNRSTFKTFKDLEDLFLEEKKRQNHYAYWIHVSGNCLLTRFVNNDKDFKNDLIYDQNEKFNFCHKDFGNGKLVTFWREDTCKELVLFLESHKRHFIGMSGGIIPLLKSSTSDDKLTSDYQVEIRDNNLITFDKNKEFCYLSNQCKEKIYDSINDYVIGFPSFYQAKEINEFKQNYAEYKQHRIFNLFGVISFSFVLIILLINKVYFKKLSNNYANSAQLMEIEMNNDSKIKQLTEEKSRKMNIVESTGFINQNFLTNYMNDICQIIPKEIRLQNLDIVPIQEIDKQNGKITFFGKTINVFGFADKSSTLYQWIKKMKNHNWVDDVKIIKLSNSENDKLGFEIKILFK